MHHRQPDVQQRVADAHATVFLRMDVVLRLTGLARSTIYRLMAEDKFPTPVRLTKRAIAWRRSVLERWSEGLPTVAH